MFRHVPELAYTVRVDRPDPTFARMLQQAIGGVEGEMRVMNQYFFQGMACRGPAKYRSMLMNTATEEIGHIEMLCTAVALNLEGAPQATVEEAAQDPAIAAMLGGMDHRQYLSAGLNAMPADANGVPFNASHVYASGNLVADMYCNVAAEATGRLLAIRLLERTEDPGMQDMLRFLIARDAMHQQQWLAVIEEIGAPIVPDDFPDDEQNQDFARVFLQHSSMPVPDDARWTSGPSLDTEGELTLQEAEPLGEAPDLPPAPELVHAGALATQSRTGN